MRRDDLKGVAFEPAPDAPTVVVTGVGAAEGARGAAAALACACADADRASLLVDFGGRPPRPTLLASAAARQLEERLASHLPRVRVAARGQVCHLAPPVDDDGFAAAAAAVTVARGVLAVLLVPPASFQDLLAAGRPRISGALLRAEVATDRALLALIVDDLVSRGLDVAVLKHRLSWVDERRALFGALGADAGIPKRVREKVHVTPCYSADNELRQESTVDEGSGRGQRAGAER